MEHAVTADSHLGRLGVDTRKLGMWIFLASEVMLFTGLIGSYIVLRFGSPEWPHDSQHLVVAIGTLNTLVLIASSVTMILALAAHQKGERGKVSLFLLLTVLLGSLFLGIKVYEYGTKFSHGFFPSSSIFWSCYFTTTGFHGLHVLCGVLVNLWILGLSLIGRLPESKGIVLDVAGLYWHFVDIVWIFLFPLLYLI